MLLGCLTVHGPKLCSATVSTPRGLCLLLADILVTGSFAHAQTIIRLCTLCINMAIITGIHLCRSTSEEIRNLIFAIFTRAVTRMKAGEPVGLVLSDCLWLEHFMTERRTPVVPLIARTVFTLKIAAAYQLGFFKLAQATLKGIRGVPKDLIGEHEGWVREYETKVARRLKEAAGKIDVEAISRELREDESAVIADYTGPIEISLDPIKGRRVITTRNVKAGEILFMERPMLKHNGSHNHYTRACTFALHNGKDYLGDLPASALNTAPFAITAIDSNPSIANTLLFMAPEPVGVSLSTTEEEQVAAFKKPLPPWDVEMLSTKVTRNCHGAEGDGFQLYRIGSESTCCPLQVYV
jgi:hypothetical protein